MYTYSEVADKVNKEELVKLTQDLLRIDSVIRPEKDNYEEKVSLFIADYLKENGFSVTVEEVEHKRPNVIAVLEGGKPGKTLLFEGHTDVVTEGIPEKWTYPPFAAEIHDGKIYGRGACDTKGNVAAMIIAARAVKESGVQFAGKIILCIPCDEEGMMIGIKHFIENGHADGVDSAIICEPEENNLCIKQKGALRIIIRVYGRQAHGAMPLTGSNPIPRAAKVIEELKNLDDEFIAVYGRDEYLGLPSVTPTVVLSPSQTEPQLNVVPTEAYIAVDIRTTVAQDHKTIVSRIEGILKRLERQDAEFKADMEVIEERPWTETSPDSEIVKAVTGAYRDVAGKDMKLNGVPGATDGTFLQCLKGIKVVVTGAGNREIPHHYDEYVEIEELQEAARLYAVSALRFLNGRS